MSSVTQSLSLYVLLILMLLVLLVLKRSALPLPGPVAVPPLCAHRSAALRAMAALTCSKTSSITDGDELVHQYWAEARVAGAPQPGGPAPDAPPVGQDAPPLSEHLSEPSLHTLSSFPFESPAKPSADCRDLHLPGAMSARSAGGAPASGVHGHVARPSVAPHLRAKAVLEVRKLTDDERRAAMHMPFETRPISLQEACSVVGEGLALCHWTWTREHVQALSYSVPRACAMVLAQPVLVECIHEALGRRPAARFRH